MSQLVAQQEINSLLSRVSEYSGLDGLAHISNQIESICAANQYQISKAVVALLKALKLDRSGKADAAAEQLELCIDHCGDDEFQIAMQAHVTVASIYCEQGNHFHGYHHYKQVLDHVSQLDAQPLCQLYTNLGGFFLILRRYQQAVDFGYRAINASTHGNNRFSHLIALINTGVSLAKLNRYHDGLPLMHQALDMAQELDTDRANALAHAYMADFLAGSDLDIRTDAVNHFDAASEHFGQLGQGYDSLLNELNYANYLVREGNYQQASVKEAEIAATVIEHDSAELLLKLEKLQISLKRHQGCDRQLLEQYDSYVAKLESQYQATLERESTLILEQVNRLQQRQSSLVANQVQENLDAITAIGQLISTSTDLDASLIDVFSQVKSIFPAHEFGIALYDQQQLNYRYFIGKDGREEPVSVACDKIVNFGSYAILTDQTVHLNNVTTEVILSYFPDITEQQRRDLTGGGNSNSVLLTPVKLGDEILGVLSVQHNDQNQYHQHHRRLFEQLASLIAIALKNLKQQEALQQSYAKLKRISTTDPLTQVFNRHHLKSLVPQLVASSAQEGLSLAIIIIDIDYYKGYNDTFGHFAGDHALVEVANILKTVFADGNAHIFRYGGDEFLVLTQGNEVEQTRSQLNNLKAGINQLGLPHPQSQCADRLTLSVGAEHATTIANHTQHFNRAFEQADKNLYQVKNSGRDNFILSVK